MEPIPRQVSCDLAAVEEWIFGEHTIDLIHQFQCLSIHTSRRVVQR